MSLEWPLELDVKVLMQFDKLWEEKIRKRLENANLTSDEVLEIITSEINRFRSTPAYHTVLNLCDDVKSNAKARDLRTKGNEMYHPKVKRYIEALKLYNESIACSEQGSEERAIAYANRSMICYQMRRYEDCLENIRLARDSNYPEGLAAKLNKREEDAKKALEIMKSKSKKNRTPGKKSYCDEIKLSYNGHRNAPQIANCLELRNSDEFGRHVVTNRKLKVGDVVMIENPVVSVLENDLRFVRCAFCYGERLFVLIPCEGCTVNMYCSEVCLSKAYSKYHRYECPIVKDLQKISKHNASMTVRSIALAIASFDHNLEDLQEHLAKLDKAKVNPFTMDWNTATARDIYSTMHFLSTNQTEIPRYEFPIIVFYATIVKQLLLERTELGPICEVNPKLRKFLFDLTLHNVLAIRTNNYTQPYFNLSSDKDLDEERYANSCSPVISMLNHSCAHNCLLVSLADGRCAVVVERPIHAGEQLFISYITDYMDLSREVRQEKLKNMFYLSCHCEACLQNYPTFDELLAANVAKPTMYVQYMIHMYMLDSGKPELVSKVLSESKCFLNGHHNQYPSTELCAMQYCFSRSCKLLYSFRSEIPNFFEYCNP